MSVDPNTPVEVAPPNRRETLYRLASELKHSASNGDLAALRRLDPMRPDNAAFWRLLVAIVPERDRRSSEAEQRWAMAINGMALMARDHHENGARLGRVLAETEFSEQRLERLLRARGIVLADLLRRMCRFLAGKARAVDWRELGEFILTRDPEAAERKRRAIAKDYYATLLQREKA
jgi:hypothetical protein